MSLDDVDALARTIGTTPWFSRVGKPMTPADRGSMEAYVSGLGLDASEIAPAATWPEAARIASDPNWDHAWWDAEAGEQARLQAAAEQRHGAGTALAALTRVTDAALEPTRAAAEAAGDEVFARVAAGAAALGCHQAALALACGLAVHSFLAKHRLFAAGRWPLGRIAGRWYLF